MNVSNSALHRHAIALLCVVALGVIAVLFSLDVAIMVGILASIVALFMLLAEPIRKRGEDRLREQRKAELRATRRGGPLELK